MLIALLIINGLIILANLIYVTPKEVISDEAFPDKRPEDVKQIIGLEELTATGWNNGNGHQLASAFTDRADYVTFNGQWLKDKTTIDTVHQQLFDGVLKGSTLEERKIRDIRFISDSVAILHVTGAVKQKWRKKAVAGRQSIQTLVAVKELSEWKFTAFHNARIRRFTLWDVIVMSVK